MSILRPINYAGAWEFKQPVPCPSGDIAGGTQVSITFNESWVPAVISALKSLTRPEAWEGTLADIQRCTSDAHNLFDARVKLGLPVGTIIPNLFQSFPPNWLVCGGQTLLRVDWPELYAVIHNVFIIDADHFFVPNLRGRFPMVAGTGTGLTTRYIGQQGGEEQHTLNVGEMPAHEHYSGTSITFSDVLTPPAAGAWRYVAAQSGVGWSVAYEATRGGDQPHENMPPFAVIQYSIIASSD